MSAYSTTATTRRRHLHTTGDDPRGLRRSRRRAHRLALSLSASGQTTALNDGYPWGLWIAFDVVTGTALACGGYAVALLVYILNKDDTTRWSARRWSPAPSATRSPVCRCSSTSGRPWLGLQAAVLLALEPELGAARSRALHHGLQHRAVDRAHAGLSRARPHQHVSDVAIARRSVAAVRPQESAVAHRPSECCCRRCTSPHSASLLLLSGPRLHPLWNTTLLPLLFLISCIAMGYGAVVLEGSLSARFLGRTARNRDAGRPRLHHAAVIGIYLILRVTDLACAASSARSSRSISYSVMSLIELATLRPRAGAAGHGAQRRTSAICSARRWSSSWRARCIASTPSWWRFSRERSGRTFRASRRSSSRPASWPGRSPDTSC